MALQSGGDSRTGPRGEVRYGLVGGEELGGRLPCHRRRAQTVIGAGDPQGWVMASGAQVKKGLRN